MNDKIQKAPMVPPFVRFVCSAVPMVFDDSLSYYEALCALWKWLQDDVVNVINNNATVTEEYIQLTNDMKEYMDNYFDNLDVQEEINNKLDDMVEAGTLQELINAYLQPNVTWTFDTVADMKVSTNLVNGCYARTLGFHSLNDGGGAIYKISNTGTANEMDVIAVGSLYATLIVPSDITPEIFGAYGDGTHDDTDALQFTFDHNASIKCNAGKTYLVDDTITLSKRKTIDFSLSTIKFTNNDVGLYVYMENTNPYSHLRFAPVIKNLCLEGENNTKVMYIDYAYKSVFDTIYVKNFSGIGIEKNRGYELVINNIYLWASNQNTTSIGLLATGNDCEYGNIFGINCHTGVKMIGGGNHFKSIHMWLFNDTQGSGMADANTLYAGSAMIEIAGNDRYWIDYAYFDSYQYCFKYTGYGRVFLNSSLVYCADLSAQFTNYLSETIYFIYATGDQLNYLWNFCINNTQFVVTTGNTVTAKMIPDGYAKKPIRVTNSIIPYDVNNLRKDFIADFTFQFCENVNIQATPIDGDKLLIHGILKKDNDADHGWRITPNDSAYKPIITNEIKIGYKDTSQYFSASPAISVYNIGANNTAESGYTSVNNYYRVEYMMHINYL